MAVPKARHPLLYCGCHMANSLLNASGGEKACSSTAGDQGTMSGLAKPPPEVAASLLPFLEDP